MRIEGFIKSQEKNKWSSLDGSEKCEEVVGGHKDRWGHTDSSQAKKSI
jgi:hypothetical protein